MERTVSEVLDDFESMWAPRMRAASLAAELQFEVQDVRWAAKCLGVLYNAQLHHARARRERIRIYPASVVIALSGIGALEYEAGTYWSAVWDITGVQGDANTAQEWGTGALLQVAAKPAAAGILSFPAVVSLALSTPVAGLLSRPTAGRRSQTGFCAKTVRRARAGRCTGTEARFRRIVRRPRFAMRWMSRHERDNGVPDGQLGTNHIQGPGHSH
jgi:hypothetical protein